MYSIHPTWIILKKWLIFLKSVPQLPFFLEYFNLRHQIILIWFFRSNQVYTEAETNLLFLFIIYSQTVLSKFKFYHHVFYPFSV